MGRINVTKTFLPPYEEYAQYLEKIWAATYLTNQGPLLKQFERETQTYLGVDNFQFVTNGTLALQLALRSLDITEGEVITTPFSYVATVSAILWERCTPVFVDIDPDTLCIDPGLIEAAITPRTKAIMPVHIYSYPCDTEAIEAIAKAHHLPVIYDAAQAFGAKYRGRSLLSYGDISIVSFHAAKLMQTIEGGGVVTCDPAVADKIELLKRFGHDGDVHYTLGLNAKASEFQAAMGLCNLKYIDQLIAKNQAFSAKYDQLLGDTFRRPKPSQHAQPNFGYYPIVLESEPHLQKITTALSQKDIFPRRYFYPSLNTLPYLESPQSCPVSEDIAGRVLCLPLYPEMDDHIINEVCEVLKR